MSPRAQHTNNCFLTNNQTATSLSPSSANGLYGVVNFSKVAVRSLNLTVLAASEPTFSWQLVLPAAALVFALLVPILANPVHALLSLLGLFATTALVYLALGAEYLGLVFLIVYVGALAILFLFIIMLLNVNDIMAAAKAGISAAYAWFSGLFVVFFAGTLFSKVQDGLWTALPKFAVLGVGSAAISTQLAHFVSTDILRLRPLYTLEHGALFGLITVILLIAMLGAIIAAKSSQSTTPETGLGAV